MPALSLQQAVGPTTAGSNSALLGGEAAVLGDTCRHPSPLPLADLLADSTHTQRQAGFGSPVPSPALAAAAAGFLSPDLGAAGGYVASLHTSPIWSAPWALAAAYGSPATPLTCLQPLAPPAMLEGPQRGFGGGETMAETAVDCVSTLVPCDLSERLASLDLVVQDFSAEVRTLTGCGAAGVAGTAVTNSANTGPFGISHPTDAPQQAAAPVAPQRHVHHI